MSTQCKKNIVIFICFKILFRFYRIVLTVFYYAHIVALLLNGEVGSGLAGFLHRLKHSLALLLSLLEPLPLLLDVTLFLLLNLADSPLLFLLLLLGETLFFFSARYLYINIYI